MTDLPTPHPSDDVVALYVSGQLTPADRSQVEAHLIDCDGCRAVVIESAAVVTTTRRPRRVAVYAMGGLAAAALAMLVITRSLPVVSEADRVRGGVELGTEDIRRLQAIAPAPGVSINPLEVRFLWHPGPGGTTYHLTISDERGVVVWNTRTPDSSIALPVDVARSLEHGRTYFWRIEALLPDLTSASSSVSTFVVSRP